MFADKVLTPYFPIISAVKVPILENILNRYYYYQELPRHFEFLDKWQMLPIYSISTIVDDLNVNDNRVVAVQQVDVYVAPSLKINRLLVNKLSLHVGKNILIKPFLCVNSFILCVYRLLFLPI